MGKIGGSDLDVTRLGLGANTFGWTADRDTAFAVLDAYVEAGGNFIDTADTYGRQSFASASETIIGEWFAARGRRDDVVLATKVGSLASRKGLSGANIAAAWAVMKYLGMEGYLEIAGEILAKAEALRDGIDAIDGLEVCGDPRLSVMSFCSPELDIHAIAAGLGERGRMS